MRAVTYTLGAFILFACVEVANGQEADRAELAGVKRVLAVAVKQIAEKVKGDEKVATELAKLKEADAAQLMRMARDIKTTFKIERLDAAELKRVEAEVKKAIEDASIDDLKKLLVDRDAEISLKMCWLIGCR